MTASKTDHLRLGLFVLAGTIVLVAGLYLLGAKRGLFRNTITVTAHFGQVSGLRPGNNVRYAGIDVGTVSSIRIVSDTAVLVTMAIRARDAGHIRTNAIAPGPFPTQGAWQRLLPGELVQQFDMARRVPLGRVGEHRELTDLAAYLISPYSSYINGEVVTIDGGEWLKGAGQFNMLGSIAPEMWDSIEQLVRGARS